MTFISIKFAIFIVFFLLIYKLLENRIRWQNALMITGNYIFYSLIDLRFSFVLVCVTLFTWTVADNMKKGRKQVLLWCGIAVNILTLLFFKYAGFLGRISDVYGIIMPIGMSFYIFEAISYLVDTYNGKIKDVAVYDALLYLSFFPLIMSGPIVKARDFLPQIHKRRVITVDSFENGVQRFLFGVFEKIVVADRLAVSVDAVYSAPSAYSGISLLWNSLSYTLQLFFDFAGYTNMAIGIATILGFRINENFNLPYIARSPSEFWKRWHISLSSWIAEYVYIPLGGSRKGTIRTYINIMIAMLISGIWHGSTLNFVIWGGCHGVAQVVEKIIKGKNTEKRCDNVTISEIAGMVFTFIVVDLLWIPFRTDDLNMTVIVLKRIFTNAKGLTYLYSYTFIFAIGLIGVEVWSISNNNWNSPLKPLNLRTFKGKFVFVTLIFVIMMFAYFGNGAFIYGAMF